MKRCTKCGDEKPLDAFSKRHDTKDGLQHRCKACTNAYLSAHYAENKAAYAEKMANWRSENPSRQAAMKRAYYEANRERIKAEMAAFYAANGEKIRARVNAYSAANADACRARAINYYNNNKEKVLASNARNRAKRQMAEGTYIAEDVAELMRRQRGLCVACRKDIRKTFHVDHVEPLSKGGTNDRLNLQLLCPRCNLSKSARHPVDFMQKKGFLL